MRFFILSRFFLLLLLFYTVFLVSCGGEVVTPLPGGGGGNPPPNVVVTISPSPATLSVKESLTFKATVTLNGTTTGVDQRLYWWITGSSFPALSTTYNYTAPGSPATATLTGQSYLNITDSATVAITVVNTNGGFTSTGSLTTPRIAHTATLLQDGTVLIVGGYNNPISPVFLSSGELYNYTTSQFSAITSSSVVYGRAFHTATLLNGGNVLIAGGMGALSTDGILNSSFAYFPSINQFAWAGYMNYRRANHTGIILPNGNVLLAGGTNGTGILSSAELFNGVTPFISTGTMTANRTYHTATRLIDGTVLVTGGNNGSVSLKSGEIFNSITGAFTTTSQAMTTERAGHTSTLLNNGTVLITGGINAAGYVVSTAEIYSPGAKAFSLTTGTMTTTRTGHQATLLSDGSVLITGGNNNLGFVTSSAEVYSPATGTFIPTGSPMNNARVNHTATLLPTGKVLISGGFDGTNALSSAEIYSP